MNHSLDLLEQADHLATRERKRPRQASLRRAVSTAYYAVYHLLTWEALLLIAPGAEEGTRLIMQRWFDHAGMFTACGLFSGETFLGPLARLAGSPPLPDLQRIARSFRELQQERHSADYDMASSWKRVKAGQQVRLTREAYSIWFRVRKQPQATIFALALLDPGRVQRERPR